MLLFTQRGRGAWPRTVPVPGSVSVVVPVPVPVEPVGGDAFGTVPTTGPAGPVPGAAPVPFGGDDGTPLTGGRGKHLDPI